MTSEVIQKYINIKLLVILLFLTISHKAKSQETHKFVDAFYDAGIQRIYENDEKAIQLYEEASELNPKSSAAHYFAALLYFNNKNFDNSIFHVKKALKIDSKQIWYNILLAKNYEKTNEPKLAEKIYKKIIKENPAEDIAYKNLLDLYIEQDEITKAESIYKEYRKYLYPDLKYQMTLYFKMFDQPKRALKFMQYIREESPNDSIWCDRIIAKTANFAENFKEERNIYMKYYKAGCKDSKMLIDMYEYFQANDKSIAESLENQMINSDADIETKIKIAKLQKKENPQKYVKTITKLAEQYPDNWTVMEYFAELSYRLKNYEQANEACKKAFKENKSNFKLNLMLLETSKILVKYAEMEKFADTVLMYMPNQTMLYCYASLACLKNGKADKAKDLILSGKELFLDDDDDIKVCYNYQMASLNFLQKNYDKALAMYKGLEKTRKFMYKAKAMRIIINWINNKGANDVIEEIRNFKDQLPSAFYYRVKQLIYNIKNNKNEMFLP